ncbi:MAG: TlpA family protein disulfide reductase [Tannerella sp.]|jgi:peroxiredoxin|nr:TlpA family protein disulfide reductase [Tannerella sp.]
MKRIYMLIFMLAAVLSSVKAQDTASFVKVDDPAPAFSIMSDNGHETLSDEYKGKVMLVVLFATWCPPCQQELAAIEKELWPKYSGNDNFVLLVIGREHSAAELVKYNEKKGFTFALYPDKDRKIYDTFAAKFIPRTYLIDKKGKVAFKTQGFNETEFKRLLRSIDNALML